MPELPEVETVAGDLRRHVLGATVVDARVAWPRTLRDEDPAAFADGVRGRRIEAVGRRAKLVVLQLSGSAVLTIHLKMTGQLFVVPADAPFDPYVRATLVLADGREVRFRDIRKFGRIGLYVPEAGAAEEADGAAGAGATASELAFAGLGPEPLEPAFDLRAFRRRIRGRRSRLKPLLTDQSFLAGVGNIYADEALWAARLHPLRSARSLRPADERHLYIELRRILTEAVERRGSSIDDYTAPDGDGEMQEHLAVYQRTGEPCERCGRPIRRIVVGGRATHLCTWCQRLPTADRAGAVRILAAITPRPGTPAGRRGRRWTELAGEGTVGTTPAERSAAARTRATREAAATRRARARGAAGTAPGPRPATEPDPGSAAETGPD